MVCLYTDHLFTRLVYKKQDGVYLSGLKMVKLSYTQIAFEYRTIWHPTFYGPFKHQTSLYSDPHCALNLLGHCSESSILNNTTPSTYDVLHLITRKLNVVRLS